MDIQARPMTRAERKAFQAAGLDMRRNASKLKQWQETEDYDAAAIFADDVEDWICDNILHVPDDMPNNEASNLAKEVYNLTFGGVADEKNSSASTDGSPKVDQTTAKTA